MTGIKLPPPPKKPESLHSKLMRSTDATPQEFFSKEALPESSVYRSGLPLFASAPIGLEALETSPHHDVGKNRFMQSLSSDTKRLRR